MLPHYALDSTSLRISGHSPKKEARQQDTIVKRPTFGPALPPPAPNTSFPEALLGASAGAAAGAASKLVRGGADVAPARAAAAAAAPVDAEGDVFGAFPSSRRPPPVKGVNLGSSGAGSGSAHET
jgi:hypothetical protein